MASAVARAYNGVQGRSPPEADEIHAYDTHIFQ